MIAACEVVERAAAVGLSRLVVNPRCGVAPLDDLSMLVARFLIPFALPGMVPDPEILAAEDKGVDSLADFGREAEEGRLALRIILLVAI